jgi:RHS repeat-associated protein
MKFNKSLIIAALSLFSASGLFAKEQAKKAEVPGVAPQPAEFFYTGKPYDTDLGAYTFNFRNYDPILNRWTSADSSGFPDGANNHIYAPIPTNAVDPLGLANVTYIDGKISNGSNIVINWSENPTATSSGVEMSINWNLKPGLTSGYIVQYANCNKTVNGIDQSYMLYEAWRVDQNGQVQGNDVFSCLTPSGSNGSVTITGYANFYSDSVIGSSSPSKWGSIGDLTGGIPSYTGSAPSWFSTSGVATHWLSATWE